MNRKYQGPEWTCCACHAVNSEIDGECQFCECGGMECKRDNCSEPQHFHVDHMKDAEPFEKCPLCKVA